MELIGTLLTGFVFVLVIAPVALLVLTFFVLVPLAHLVPRPAMVGRATFTCPVSRQPVRASFLTAPGAEHPADVLGCSMFADGRVRCQKGCLGFVASSWRPSPMVPPFSLLADGVTLRELSPANGGRVKA
jgi:hypothetical protein